jgi:hypothetical protein
MGAGGKMSFKSSEYWKYREIVFLAKTIRRRLKEVKIIKLKVVFHRIQDETSLNDRWF